MLTQLFSGFLTGLSTGVYCISACLPIFVPLLLADQKNLKSSFWIVIEFSLGRLLGYLCFGTIIGFLGKVVVFDFIHRIVGLATILMGAALIAYGISSLRWKYKACRLFMGKIKIPLLLGFLTGVNVCPPFIASLAYVFNLKNVLSAIFYFLSFFLGTSLYIIPLGFLGYFSSDSLVQKVARISGIFVGAFFVYSGIMNLL